MKDLISIEIIENDKVIGRTSASEFRSFFGIKNVFVQDLVEQYNREKAAEGSSLRARVIINK